MGVDANFAGNVMIVEELRTGATQEGQRGTTLTGITTGAQTITGVKTFSDGIKTKQAVTNVNDTAPTAAELTTAFGAPATLGRGYVGTIDDADGDTNGFIVWVSDASFYYLKGTKAV